MPTRGKMSDKTESRGRTQLRLAGSMMRGGHRRLNDRMAPTWVTSWQDGFWRACETKPNLSLWQPDRRGPRRDRRRNKPILEGPRGGVTTTTKEMERTQGDIFAI
jgi:hypothetical protein